MKAEIVDVHETFKLDMIAFGRWVAEKRAELNLSLDALAKRVGIEKSYLSRIERGERNNPSFVVVYILSKELGRALDDIIKIAG